MNSIIDSSKLLGFQLWSLKDLYLENPIKTIEKIAFIGYNSLELYQTERGLLNGVQAAEFRNLLTDQNLAVKSAHCNPFVAFEKTLDLACEVGIENLICPWLGFSNSPLFYRKALERFNYCADLCHQLGLQFGYHNHDYSFKKTQNIVPIALFLEETDPTKMFFEIDVYWFFVANQNPLAWLEKYPKRWKIAHIKDLAFSPKNQNPHSTLLGHGIIDYRELIPEFSKLGLESFYVEQEYFVHCTPLEAAKENFEYMKSVIY
jgi:sugar phosphate isomerase/epimerase